jgi:hypothetical protein
VWPFSHFPINLTFLTLTILGLVYRSGNGDEGAVLRRDTGVKESTERSGQPPSGPRHPR